MAENKIIVDNYGVILLCIEMTHNKIFSTEFQMAKHNQLTILGNAMIFKEKTEDVIKLLNIQLEMLNKIINGCK